MIETSLNGPSINRKNNQDNQSNEVLEYQRPKTNDPRIKDQGLIILTIPYGWKQ